MNLPAGARLGPYEIVAKLGEGGMGAVYRARDTRLGREVAVKVPAETLLADPAALERFDREARTASSLSHPNICTIFDVGIDPPHLAMELLEGATLEHALRHGGFDVATALDHAIGIADGLDTAHAKGLIHRDIKPANIFVTARGPKILDFGLAKSTGDQSGQISSDGATRMGQSPVTQAGTAVGTVAYMSPEQLRGLALDGRSDLFSFGLVLYEMLTGRPAFPGETSAVISAAILHTAPVPPRTLQPALPARIEDIVLKLLEKDREDRYQTAADLRADLRRARRELDGSHASTVITAAASQASRPQAESDSAVIVGLLRRRRGAAIGAVVVVLAVAGGAYWALGTGSGAATLAPVSPADLELVPLTQTGTASQPAMSADGRYIAYVESNGSDQSVWIRQTGSANNVQIVPAEPGTDLFGLTVSNDGAFVDFVRGVVPDQALYRVPFLGGTPKKIVEKIWSPIGWSPDGRQLAFLRLLSSRERELIVANADGTNQRQVLTMKPDRAVYAIANGVSGSVAAPAWSPDGGQIAFRAEEGTVVGSGRPFVVLANVADGTADWRALPAPLAGAGTVAWLSPNALVLSQGTGPRAPKQLWRMSVPDGQLTRLTNDLSDYSGLSLAADRASLVTARVDRRVGVWVADAVGRNPIELAPLRTESAAFRPHLGWLGPRVAFTRGSGVWAVEPEGGSPVELVADAVAPSGSRDGKTLLYASIGANGSDLGIRRLNLDGGAVSRLHDTPARMRLAPDAAGYLLLTEPRLRLVWTPLNGGAARELNQEFVPGNAFDVSRDGTRVVWAGASAAVTYSYCELPACASARTITAPPRALGVIRITPGNTGVAYIDKTGSNIWLQPFDGGKSHPLTSFRDLVVQDFDWSFDGKHLAIMRSDGRQDIVMIKGLR
jgi:hypothetical protein